MAKGKSAHKFAPRKDGQPRNKRQMQTQDNGRNFVARQFYDNVRPGLLEDLKRLKKDNADFAKLYYGLKEAHDKLVAEHRALQQKHDKVHTKFRIG